MLIIRFVLASLSLALIALIYIAGLPGDFAFDDSVNLLENKRFVFVERDWTNVWRATFSSDSGPFGRPVSMFSFALNQYFSGIDSFYFKLTNIGIHLANVGLVYVLCALLLRTTGVRYGAVIRHWSPLVMAAMWGLLPINLTSVLYVIQRMTSLSAFFMLLALICYCWGRLDQLEGGGRSAFWKGFAGFSFFGALAILSKESALLIPLFMFLIEAYLLHFKERDGGVSVPVLAANLLVAVLPVMLVAGYALLRLDWLLGGYAVRSFTLEERVLTEARGLWFYLRQIVLPDVRAMGLFHDDFVLSRGLLDPPTTLFALLGVVGLVAAAIVIRRRLPLVAFGIAWYLVGHLLESTVFALELIHEHRNYFPAIGIVIALVGLAAEVPEAARKLVWCGLLPAMMIGYGAATYARALQWNNLTDHAISEAHNHPNSSRANFQLGRVYGKWMISTSDQRYYLAAKEAFEQSIAVDMEKRSGGYFGLIHLAYQAGHEPEEDVVIELTDLLAKTSAIGLDLAFLGQLGKCQVDRVCKLPDAKFEAIAGAFLLNPKLSDGFRASVLSILGVYSANKKDDWVGAERYFIEAARLADRADHWLALAEYYRVIGNYPSAYEALARSRLTGDNRLYAYEIGNMSERIGRSSNDSDDENRGAGS